LSHVFHLVDVFAERPYAGNQLAVVLGADDLSSEQMQEIARETNFSETTFLPASVPPGAAPVRIFTPAEELPFAGHPTLGTAWVIRTLLEGASIDEVVLELGVGPVPVRFERDAQGEIAWLRAPRADFDQTVPHDEAAHLLGLTPGDLDPELPVQAVGAGHAALIVPLASRTALESCRPEARGIAALAERGIEPYVYFFCREPRSPENDLAARFFFDANGVREDPATGSAAGCLGAYLLHHRAVPKLEHRMEQGVDMGRPSLIRLRGELVDGAPAVSVGGRVFHVARGELL